MDITYKQIQGQRPYQEDTSLILGLGDSMLLAVFDGHSGNNTSNTLREKTKAYANINKEYDSHFLKTLYVFLNSFTRYNEDGSTASCVLITPDKIQVAILGDSPVQLLNNDTEIRFPEHNVRNNYEEADAAIKRGGFISDGYLFDASDSAIMTRKGLQMSRAFGDVILDKVLLRTPDIYTYERKDIQSVLVATDGVLDPGHERTNFILTKHSTADDLIDDSSYYFDNATAIVAQL